MKMTIDYSKSPSPKFDAVEDVKKELGARWAVATKLMARVIDPEDFTHWAGFTGVEGFPVGAWYELYHGEGSWGEAWAKRQREQYEAARARPTSVSR